MKRYIIGFITFIMFLVFIIGASALDSTSNIPVIMVAVSTPWLGIWGIAESARYNA